MTRAHQTSAMTNTCHASKYKVHKPHQCHVFCCCVLRYTRDIYQELLITSFVCWLYYTSARGLIVFQIAIICCGDQLKASTAMTKWRRFLDSVRFEHSIDVRSKTTLLLLPSANCFHKGMTRALFEQGNTSESSHISSDAATIHQSLHDKQLDYENQRRGCEFFFYFPVRKIFLPHSCQEKAKLST